jgi:CRP-like cAMP-binding protein
VTVFQEAELLRKVPTFGKLDPAKLKLLAFTSRVFNFADGDALMRQGEASDSVYLIMDGRVDVLVGKADEEFVLGTAGFNEMLGEMGVLMNAPRSATVRAHGPVKALRISSEVFLRLLSENAEVALDVMRQLSERLAGTLRKVENLQERVDRLEHTTAGSRDDP